MAKSVDSPDPDLSFLFLTREEIRGLMSGLLDVDGPAAGTTRLSDWCRAHADQLGHHYASELARRRDRTSAYIALPHLTGGNGVSTLVST